MNALSLTRVYLFAFTAPVKRIGEILPRIIVSWIAGGLLLYGTLNLYFVRLEMFLYQPSDRAGSLVLGVATAGLLLLLFLHSMISASMTAVFLDTQEMPATYLRARRREWRLYASNLRFALLLAAFVFVYIVGRNLSNTGVAIFPWSVAWNIAASGALAWGFARVWFLATPVSVTIYHGSVLRRAWRLSEGHGLTLVILVTTLLIPPMLLEVLGEIALRAAGELPSVNLHIPFKTAIAYYSQILPVMVCILSVAYLVGMMLISAARADAYRQLSACAGS